MMGQAEPPAAELSATLAPAADTDEGLRELWRQVLPVYSNSFAPQDQEAFLETTTFSAKGHNHQLDDLISTYDVSADTGQREFDRPEDEHLARSGRIPGPVQAALGIGLIARLGNSGAYRMTR
jgi:hypothetical protein